MTPIKISIRSLVEFIYRGGDLDATMKSSVSMVEGTRIHQLVQSNYVGFTKEVALKYTCLLEGDIEITLSGRADGIKDDDTEVVIDEIKSTFEDVDHLDEDFSFLHWAQVMLYGAIYTKDKGLDAIDLQLSYYSLKTETIKQFRKHLTAEALGEFLEDTLDKYKQWVYLRRELDSVAIESAKGLAFPFPSFRQGQDVLAKAVYSSIRDANHLIAEAPTGIGKTMSSLYPAIKAFGSKLTCRIFYLTSKSLHRKVALDACEKLTGIGLKGVVVGLQAKEKMCTNDVFKCSPDFCPYAKGHYDRINEALYTILNACNVSKSYEGIRLDPHSIREEAERFVVCPFELALDLSDFSHVVIGDYNYYLDPFVQLKRHFSEPSDATVLIDESHNLYERARDMYTCTLTVSEITASLSYAKSVDKGYHKQLLKVRRSLKKNLEHMDDQGVLETIDLSLINAITSAMLYFQDQGRYTGAGKDLNLVNLFFKFHRFIKLYEFVDEHFVLMVPEEESGTLMIRCIDPSKILTQNYKLVRSVIGFSATLSPFSFYQKVLGHHESKRLQVGSPFDVSNRLLIINTRHSTYQKDRLNSIGPIAEDTAALIASKKGNYLIFCPSYQYLQNFADTIAPLLEHVKVYLQKGGMSEEQREEFLEAFQLDSDMTTVGLVVMGGVFSEGIDLQGDRLSGVIIIGVGMPLINRERNLMKLYYDQTQGNGFDYAYTYPGLNKVFQAGGRLIRTENDRGLLMLICKRYGEMRFKREFPRHWHPSLKADSEESWQAILKKCEVF
jgi:DNA excision repair protein ERCC-2